jgi:hypothetical protein
MDNVQKKHYYLNTVHMSFALYNVQVLTITSKHDFNIA